MCPNSQVSVQNVFCFLCPNSQVSVHNVCYFLFPNSQMSVHNVCCSVCPNIQVAAHSFFFCAHARTYWHVHKYIFDDSLCMKIRTYVSVLLGNSYGLKDPKTFLIIFQSLFLSGHAVADGQVNT